MKNYLILILKAIFLATIITLLTVFVFPIFIFPFLNEDNNTLVLYFGLIFTMISCSIYIKNKNN